VAPEAKTLKLGRKEFSVKDLTVQFYEELQALKLVPLQAPQSHKETLHQVIMDNTDSATTNEQIDHAIAQVQKHLKSFLSFE
jgi:hypothetical protein